MENSENGSRNTGEVAGSIFQAAESRNCQRKLWVTPVDRQYVSGRGRPILRAGHRRFSTPSAQIQPTEGGRSTVVGI